MWSGRDVLNDFLVLLRVLGVMCVCVCDVTICNMYVHTYNGGTPVTAKDARREVLEPGTAHCSLVCAG